jgi:hypothetical protein
VGFGNRSSGIPGLGEVDAKPRHVQIVVDRCSRHNAFDRAGAVMDEWLYNLVNGDPKTWRQVKGFAGAVAFGLLVYAAIYELVAW